MVNAQNILLKRLIIFNWNHLQSHIPTLVDQKVMPVLCGATIVHEVTDRRFGCGARISFASKHVSSQPCRHHIARTIDRPFTIQDKGRRILGKDLLIYQLLEWFFLDLNQSLIHLG